MGQKMSNPAFMSVCIVGDRRQMRSLYQKMLRLQNRKEPLIENGFYYPKRWLGNLVARLGGDYKKVCCRGTWADLSLNNKRLYFFTESAWQAPFDVLHLIKKRFELDMPQESDYYDTIEEVAELVGNYIGHHIEPTKEAVYAAIEEWEEDNDDINAYINLKEFEIVSLDEV